MENNIDDLIGKLLDKEQKDPYLYGDKLKKIGTQEVFEKLISVVKGGNMEEAFIATKVLGQMEDNEAALDAVLEVIHDPTNKNTNGGLVSLLEEFDLSGKFVDVFRIYLFGNFKSSVLAKSYLDYTEFDITPRVLKKAEKHWNHYTNNSKQDEEFELKKEEVETMLSEMKAMFEE